MKKIINNPSNYVNDALEGIYLAYPNEYTYVGDDIRCLVSKHHKPEGKVAIVTAGGFGHLPIFLGYVGEGMLDGCAVGNVFASPAASQMYEVTKAVNAGAGVLYIYGNYSGDKMNFQMAGELSEMDGIKTEHIIVTDDIASAGNDACEKRRGVAGLIFAYKIAGAAAEAGLSLEEVADITRNALENTRTIGVALSSCTIPEIGKANFEVAEDEMEIGMGIHGEPGIQQAKMMTANEVTKLMTDRLLADLPYQSGDQVAVIVNGLGATSKEELFIVYGALYKLLQEAGITIDRKYIGEYATSMEMAGFSISLMKLDDKLKEYLDRPVYTPFFEQSK